MKFSWVAALLSIGVSGALSSCSGGGSKPREDETTAAQLRQANRVRPASVRTLIDLPSSLFLKASDFSTRFGEPLPLPEGFMDPGKALADNLVSQDSVGWFQPRGLPMIVSFRRDTHRVLDVLLLGPDEATIMQQASLQPHNPAYLVLPVFQPRHPDKLLGLRIVPVDRPS